MQKIGNIEIGGKISIGTFLKGNVWCMCRAKRRP